MSTVRAAFVMEQTLGHVTHFENLQTAAARQRTVIPTWLPIAFDPAGVERFIPGYRGNWSVRAAYRARRRVSDELATRRIDALFFHTQITALFSRHLMRQTPSVVSLDATPVNYDAVGLAYGHRPAKGSWIDRRKYEINRDTFHEARALVTWSEWARASLIRDYGVPPERVTVIPPGAASDYFRVGEERLARGARTGGVTRLLFVGGDFARKGGPLLLESLRSARTTRPFEVHIVTRQPVPAMAGVTIHYNVSRNSRELLRLFRDADAFLLPSLGDCLPVALMEASAAALPIVATDVGATVEAAVPGESAIVIASGDGRALRTAIEKIVDDAPFRLRLGTAAYGIARARFDAQRNGAAIFGLVASVARRAEARRIA